MSWGAPLGFSSGKSPFECANTATIGEPGFFLHHRHVPRVGYPDRAEIGFPCGRAIINDLDDAIAYLTTEQSTSIHAAAAYYLGRYDKTEANKHPKDQEDQ